MKTNENPLLYRIVVCLERETSPIYNNTGLYQSSNSPRLCSKTGFTNDFWYACYHSYAAIIHIAKPKSPAVWACLGVDPLDMHLSGERRKMLSITHHALSPPPSHHHLYIIHLVNWLQRFYRITMSLKRPLPKSDKNQWFTTTTFIWCTQPEL